MEILNWKHGGLGPHSSKTWGSTDLQIFLRAAHYFSFSLEPACWSSLVFFHQSACLLSTACRLLVTFDPVHDCYSSGWFWNLFATPGLLKHQSSWELQRRGKVGADIYSSCILRYSAVLYQMHHTTTWLGQPLGFGCRNEHQKLYGLGSRAPKCSKSF